MTDTAHVFRYELDDALRVADNAPPVGATASHVFATSSGYTDDFYGDADTGSTGDEQFAHALAQGRNGDHSTALDIRRKLATMPTLGATLRPTMRWSDSDGTQLDVGRYAVGDPQCLVDTVRATRPTMTVKIVVERAVSANITTDEIRTVGASVLAVVEQLRLSGIPTEVWVAFTQRHTDVMSGQVKIQEAGRPVNVDVLGFWVANPAAFRRLGFALQEQQSDDVRQLCGISHAQAYGYPTNTPNDDGYFDEVAPSRAHQVEAWVSDVLTRRTGR